MRLPATADPNAVLTNAHVWSPDGERLVYDCRSDPAGSVFDSGEIRAVDVRTGRVETLYRARNGAHCGVAMWHPLSDVIVFILGPESPGDGYDYAASRRQGMTVDLATGVEESLDARDLETFTPGSLAGGTHVHQFSPDGLRVSFTYDDHWRAERGTNQRAVGVGQVGRPVQVPARHPRNHSGSAACGLVAPADSGLVRTWDESWVGPGSAQLAFPGLSASGETELSLATLPDDLDPPRRQSRDAAQPPLPGVVLSRLTRGDGPSLAAPRHWPRADPAGERIAYLRLVDGVAKLWTVSPGGGDARPVPHAGAAESAFTWHNDGVRVAVVLDGRVALVDYRDGRVEFLTGLGEFGPRPEACVASPDGRRVAYLQPVRVGGRLANVVAVAAC